MPREKWKMRRNFLQVFLTFKKLERDFSNAITRTFFLKHWVKIAQKLILRVFSLKKKKNNSDKTKKESRK